MIQKVRRLLVAVVALATFVGAGVMVANPAKASPTIQASSVQAMPVPQHPVPSCSNYFQGALTNVGSHTWASPIMTSPTNSVCGDVHVQHLTNSNWAPISANVRIRVYPCTGITCQSYVGDWVYFINDCYECSHRVTTGAWGGLRYRIEVLSIGISGAYFAGAH